MARIKIGEKEFEFRLTLESWKRLKESCGITPNKLQEKINEDMAGVISALVFYGISPEDRKEMTQEKIDGLVDLSMAKQITDIVSESLSVKEKDDEPKN